MQLELWDNQKIDTVLGAKATEEFLTRWNLAPTTPSLDLNLALADEVQEHHYANQVSPELREFLDYVDFLIQMNLWAPVDVKIIDPKA